MPFSCHCALSTPPANHHDRQSLSRAPQLDSTRDVPRRLFIAVALTCVLLVGALFAGTEMARTSAAAEPVGLPPGLTNQLVAFYPLNGDTVETRSGQRAANLNVRFPSPSGPTTAHALFRATGAKLLLGNEPFDLANDLTVSCWVYPTAATDGYLVSRTTGTKPYVQYLMCVLPHDDQHLTPYWQINNEEAKDHHVLAAGTMGLNQWHHLAGTMEGTVMRLYVNGEPVGGETRFTGSRCTLPIQSSIGCRGTDPVGSTKGCLADVGIWSRALTATEVRMLYTSTLRTGTPVLDPAARTPGEPADQPATVARPKDPPAPVPAATPAPPAEYVPLVKSYRYNAETAKGVLVVDVAGKGIDVRDWVVKNIGKIASSKEMLLEAGKESNVGGRYKVLNESLQDGLLTVEFEVLH